ncbi:MAG: hypothetical protein RJB38_1714 [Pseudomonadota bacterium]|jgi:CPA2 family monovalent cation:H+ antiporter-2
MHLSELIHDLGVILAIAAAVSLVFHRIRQPVVLGYICAGVLASAIAGPFRSEVRTLADLGVIFLMFSLGLEFSFRKVVRLGPSVAFASGFEVLGVFAAGFLVSRLWGCSAEKSLMVAGMVAISSTTVIVKALDELGLKTRRFAQLTLGILVFEDLLAILLLVILGGLSSGRGVPGGAVASSLGTLILFVGGWFLAGTWLLPRVLKRMSASESDEMLVMVAIGLCMAMGIAAAQLGYSSALGAFLMGSILAESAESHRIEELVRPLRDLFAAIFFVSVGMLIDPAALLAHWPEILGLTLVVIVGKFFFSIVGLLLSGRPLKTAVLVGGSLIQIGEFSFIIAALGIRSGFLEPEAQPIIVAVSVLTTLITPFSVRWAPRWVAPLEGALPATVRRLLEDYAAWSERRAAARQPDPELRAAGLRWALAGFVVTLVSRVAMRFASPAVGGGVGLLLLPFLWVFLRGVSLSALRLTRVRWRLFRASTQVLALAVASILAWPFFRGSPVVWIFAVGSAVLIVWRVGTVGSAFQWLERNFLETLEAGQEKQPGERSALRRFAPWDGQLVRLKVHPDAEVSGQSIQEAALRNRFGLNIVAIQRGSRLKVAPHPQYLLFPKDEILVLGNEDQVERARKVIEHGVPGAGEASSDSMENYELRAMDVNENSLCAGKTIRESQIRDRFSALVVGLERDGKRMMNPDSALRIHAGDTLWIVGESAHLTQLAQELVRAQSHHQTDGHSGAV